MFTITATIEGNLAQMQELYAVAQECDPSHESSEIRVQQVQQAAEKCAADTKVAQDLLHGLCLKISAPVE